MREYVDELVKVVKAHREGVKPAAFSSWETRAGRPLPEDVKTLYRTLDGGEFPGEVKLLSFLEVATQIPENLVVLGTRASVPETVLLMLTRADFERHSDGRPSWLSTLAQNDWMFALRKGDHADLKPARTFMGLLERVIPPRETETFGDATFARGLSAVAAALENLPDEVTDGSATPIGTAGSALVALRHPFASRPKPPSPKKKVRAPVAKTRPAAKKSAPTRKAASKPKAKPKPKSASKRKTAPKRKAAPAPKPRPKKAALKK